MPRSYKLEMQGFSAGFEDVLTELFLRCHKTMTELAESWDECAGMGATLSLAWFVPGRMYFGHIGDSRIYHLPREGGITQLSHDDTHVGWLRRTGKINEREQRTHPRRNALQRALGAGNRYVEPQIGAVPCESGDRFLLCTDGVVEGLWDKGLESLIRETNLSEGHPPAAVRVVETAIHESGRDNATAVVVEMV
jgi:protein phosphatase